MRFRSRIFNLLLYGSWVSCFTCMFFFNNINVNFGRQTKYSVLELFRSTLVVQKRNIKIANTSLLLYIIPLILWIIKWLVLTGEITAIKSVGLYQHSQKPTSSNWILHRPFAPIIYRALIHRFDNLCLFILCTQHVKHTLYVYYRYIRFSPKVIS